MLATLLLCASIWIGVSTMSLLGFGAILAVERIGRRKDDGRA